MQTATRGASVAPCPHARQASQPGQMARPVAHAEESAVATAVATWLPSRDADGFPYDAVVDEFHRVGKHFVATTLLEALAAVRATLPEIGGSLASVRLLDRFLDTALDKWDGRYANPTYLGLSLLSLPAVDDHTQDIAAIERQYDRLLVQLIADSSRFEIAAAEGATDLLPEMRPDARTTVKRCRLALQIAGPAVKRLHLGDGLDAADPIDGARHLWANLEAGLTRAERRRLQLTMLPVSLVHDEYQFIRVLQAFEATFALVAVQLRAAIDALSHGGASLAIRYIHAAGNALYEVAPLWSLVATMQVEAFQAFREFTDGASAIQSRNYKIVESLCRQPDRPRVDSAAYLTVPEVRQRVLAGQITLDDACAAARHADRLSPGDVDALEQAMRHFAATLLRWRRTHYKNAVRMLGERTGTGYTEGAPYLAAVMKIPVFLSLAQEEVAEERDIGIDETAPGPAPEATAARGRCPFAGGVFHAVAATEA
jgi:tryptophan 2,3-dioxygenase